MVGSKDIKTHDVYFRRECQTGIITLDRPHTLNALNLSMIMAIRRQLLQWMHDDQVEMVIIESHHARAFCAGGDLRALFNALREQNLTLIDHLFRQEYALNYLIRSYPKPYIAFLDGIAMGGGIGISVHGKFRILGDHVKAAMPETNLGYFPDVGASIFLNEAPGKLGMYLGLTGVHLNTAETLYSHLGTHYVPSNQHHYLKEKLINCPQKDMHTLEALINSFQRPVPMESALREQQAEIDRLFARNTLEDILSSLTKTKSKFAGDTFALLTKRSPTSLKITFELLARGRHMTIAEAMSLDFALSQRLIDTPDFTEGIRATIIDKDKTPHWRPREINQVREDFIASLFEPSATPLELDLVSK